MAAADRARTVEKCPGSAALSDSTRMSDSAIRNRIREFRRHRGDLTQLALAQRCGVTRQTIIALEAGRYSPSLELAFKLARALERNLEEVFEFAEKK
jgi:putative transcriptional regulator